MTKKEKIKKWLKENYKSLLVKIVLGIFLLFFIFEQVKTCSNNIDRDNTHSSITKRMHINTEGNYVSDNILIVTDKETTTINGITYSINNGIITLNGISTANTTLQIGKITNFSLNDTFTLKTFNNNVYFQYAFYNGNTWLSTSGKYLDTFTFQVSNSNTDIISILIYISNGEIIDNSVAKPMLVKGSTAPTSYEPYGLTYFSQEYINNHYVSNEENEKQNNIAYNNGLTTNLQKALIDLLDTSSISGVYTYDSQNNINYSVNYYDSDYGIRLESLQNKKGLIVQYNRKYNVDTLRFDIPSTSFVANDGGDYNYFKIYCYNSDTQSYVDLNGFTINDGQININQIINNKLAFDRFIIGFDYLSSITTTFESLNLNRQVDHIYTSYYDTIYNLGYNDAILSGESYNNGYKNGFADGEKSGIYQGQLMQTEFSIGDIMKSIISAPVEVFGATLDFDIPGTNINIFSIIKLVVSLCVIGFAIKFFRS